MRILLTGAAGFIGAPVARRLLREGHEVHALVRETTSLDRLGDAADRLRWVRADLADAPRIRAAVGAIRPELAIHLAWYAVPGKYWTAPENRACVGMTLDLGRALADAGCRRLVAAGTCAEYDWASGHLSESTPCAPLTPYGAAKHEARLGLEALCRSSGMGLAWVRFFHLYGPGEVPRRLVPATILSLLDGDVARCTHGEQVRDFLEVGEAADAVHAVAASTVEGPVNVASGRPAKIRMLVETIARLLGRPGSAAFGAIPADPADPPVLTADVRRLRDAVGWSPALTLEQGLERTIGWWRKRRGGGEGG